MFINHIKISVRNLWKNKTLSLLNLIGLSIGIASVLALMFSVYKYYTADDVIKNKDDIYYLKTYLKDGNDVREVPYPMRDKVLSSSTDIIEATPLHSWGNIWLESDGKDFQKRTDYADPSFFKVFGLPLKYGNPETALKEKYSIVLTHKVSQLMFGDKNPVGKTLIGADTLNLKITGVLEPISPYSSLRIGVLLPNTILKNNPIFKSQTNWSNSFSPLFLKLRENPDTQNINTKLNEIVKKNYFDPSRISNIELVPFDVMRTDSIPVVKVIISSSIVASLFILLIILTNLLNLNTSTMLGRTKTIAMRKVLGSSKKSLIVQYCVENGILVFTSILISAILFLGISLPKLNDVFGPEFGRISFNLVNDYPVIIGILIIGLVATLLVSFFPSLRFVKIPVYLGIKGKLNQVKSNFLLRNSLIILQFSIAILCICIAIILNTQIGFMKNADLGFDRNNVIVGSIDLDYKNIDLASSKFNALINQLESNPYVKSVSTSEAIPSDYYNNYSNYFDVQTGKDVRIRRSYADDLYFKTIGVSIVEGRNFNKNIDSNSDYKVIINQSTMRAFGWKTIEGKNLNYKGSKEDGLPIVGVVKDFHYEDLQDAVEPLVHIYRDRNRLNAHRYLTVKVASNHLTEVEKFIDNAFNNISSRKQYVQSRLVDKVSGQYLLIEGILKSVSVTAILAIFISCLGLFGLISFSSKRKVKEIGVRKVLGASVTNIVVLLSKDYIKLIVVSAIIAFPIAWYAMSSWLNTFAYRIEIKWWMFVIAFFMAFFITSFTLGVRAIRSATENPVKALKTE